MSRLIIPEHFGEEVISAQKLQANFKSCETALNNLNGDNFNERSIVNECLVAHTVSSMVTFEPSQGLDISWAGLHRLGWVTYSDWEVYKVAAWCSSNANSSTVQLVTTVPTRKTLFSDYTQMGPTITPKTDEVVHSPVYGLTLKKGLALWYRQLLSDGTEGTNDVEGPIGELRISLYFRSPLRRL